MGEEKPKFALYWGASCGGCEVAVLNLHEKFLDFTSHFDLVFCPCLIDTKKKDVEAMADGSIAVTLFNGGIRSEENIEMAELLRKKSRLLIAFGSCATEGCIPGLANLGSDGDIFKAYYLQGTTTENPDGVVPVPETAVPEGPLRIPALLPRLKVLEDVTEVDYFIPGCPPEPGRIWDVLGGIIEGKSLPPRGSVIGAGNSAVCEECSRPRAEKKIKKLYRTYEIIPETDSCLLDQGVLCMGIATRSGCGALCPKVNMPCTGCYGTPDGILDQGAKMVSALGSILDPGVLKGLSEEEISRRIDELLESIPDPVGTFYKFSLPRSILKGRVS